ncbi:MAG: hypothetical protein OQK32_09145 [Gammaproteobacteria bacterium]|nr:hypothetical protein [Gammaproteobacteria bacterium]MCW8924441.1 hypothetical protein [Gammaproteobacteria bacterium]
MNYSFEAKNFRQMFDLAVSEGIDTSPLAQQVENSPERLIEAMLQAIDVMARAEADIAADGDIGEKDITEIGDYVMTLIEGLLGHAQTGTDSRSMTQVRALTRLTLPVAMWVARCGGRLDKLELVVNALADYANELRKPEDLAELTGAVATILPAVSDAVRQDLEQANPMRPWRILNLNYCIIATRSHDPGLIEAAYDVLVKNLPQDARSFFKEGLQQMDAIGYPESVREVLDRYDKLWGAESTLH